MKRKNWRENIDTMIKDHLEIQINEAAKHRNSYRNSKDPAKAQLWIAVANLSKQIFELNLKLNYIERALRDLGKKER